MCIKTKNICCCSLSAAKLRGISEKQQTEICQTWYRFPSCTKNRWFFTYLTTIFRSFRVVIGSDSSFNETFENC